MIDTCIYLKFNLQPRKQLALLYFNQSSKQRTAVKFYRMIDRTEVMLIFLLGKVFHLETFAYCNLIWCYCAN